MSLAASRRYAAWMGFPDPDPLAVEQLEALEAALQANADLLWPGVSSEEASVQLRRLEEAAHLLPALLHVLDVREVFDRLSVIAKRALAHDLLVLRIFSEDLKSLTTYASSDGGSAVGVTVPQAYPASVTRSWHFDIVDDLSTHAIEQHLVAATLGARSTLRIPIWFGNRVIGGVGFVSLEPDRVHDRRRSHRAPPRRLRRRRAFTPQACRGKPAGGGTERARYQPRNARRVAEHADRRTGHP